MLLLETTTAATGVTPFIWMVTGVGFLLVVALLFVFVYVMKLMGWIMRPRIKTPRKPVGTPAVQYDETVVYKQGKFSKSLTLTADSTAAIALALHLYYNGIHDEENTKITINPHRTQWNDKAYGMNNLHR